LNYTPIVRHHLTIGGVFSLWPNLQHIRKYKPYRDIWKVQRDINGTSLRETAAVFNIPAPSTLILWQKQCEAEGVDALKLKKKGCPST